MRPLSVKVPGSLLQCPDLSASAKLVWMGHQLRGRDYVGQCIHRVLAEEMGLSWPTVREGLRELESTGRLVPARRFDSSAGWVMMPMPTTLIEDKQAGVSAKLLYAFLQLVPGFADNQCQIKIMELSRLTSLSRSTLKLAMEALGAGGWLRCEQPNKFRLITFRLLHPEAERRERMVAEVRHRLTQAKHRGEALMREYLTLLVDKDEYEDNASPGYLVNPYTGEELQFDRYYPPRLAFEFNGAQHYSPTEWYPSQSEFALRQGRDLMKAGYCFYRGICLEVFHPEDLSLERMRYRLKNLVCMRRLEGKGPIVDYLEAESRKYRRVASLRGPRGVAQAE